MNWKGGLLLAIGGSLAVVGVKLAVDMFAPPTEGEWTDTYRCSGTTWQRQWRNADDTLVWVDVTYNFPQCVGGNGNGPPPPPPPSLFPCPIEGSPCSTGEVYDKTCPGGEIRREYECVDGAWEFTGYICPVTPGDTNYVEIYQVTADYIKGMIYSQYSQSPGAFALRKFDWLEDLGLLLQYNSINQTQYDEIARQVGLLGL